MQPMRSRKQKYFYAVCQTCIGYAIRWNDGAEGKEATFRTLGRDGVKVVFGDDGVMHLERAARKKKIKVCDCPAPKNVKNVVKIPPKSIISVKATASKYFGVLLTDSQAKKLIESDKELTDEAKASEGDTLDTYGRDILIMALIEMILPGKPTVQDDLISRELKYWHYPCNGSSEEYSQTFYTNFAKAAEEKGYRLRKNWPYYR